MKRILVAVDGSDNGWRALAMAEDLAIRYGAELEILNVILPLPNPPDFYGLTIESVEREHRRAAEELMAQARKKVKDPTLKVRTVVLYGPVADSVAEAAQADDAGIVVVGSRGRGVVARALLGSVSSRLVHICEKLVLVVR